jgi:LruC domain-containing protein
MAKSNKNSNPQTKENPMNKLKNISLAASVLLFSALPAWGFTLNKGQINWEFHPGSYAGNYDSAGIPNAIGKDNKTYPDQFWQDLSAALPEGKDVRLSNPDYITDDLGANLVMKETGELFITFLHEGAGYRNSIGYFVYDPLNPPQSKQELLEKIVFPNASFSNSGGSARGLKSGDTLNLGVFKAGTHIGFVIVSDGFDSSKGVKPTADPNWIFYTLKGLNSETKPELKGHTVLLHDKVSGSNVLGLEDILRTSNSCDQDFNDVLITLSSNPITAIDTSHITALPEAIDTDNDGVLDGNDAFPTDAERAFISYYPAKINGQVQYNTLAFEDNWPQQGDYDMNDLVIKYNFEQVSNAQGQIKDIHYQFAISARGAELHNAFALEIPNAPVSNLLSANLSIDQGKPEAILPESGQKNLVFNLIADATQAAPAPAGCRFFNTEANCSPGQGKSYQFNLSFKTPLAKSQIGLPPYNPFIYRTDQRGLEVHLPDQPPTSRANTALFGSRDDNSNVTQKRYYKTQGNLPWGLDIASDWQQPLEQAEISKAYPDFKSWAESKGSLNQDWYQTHAQLEQLYSRH